MVAQETGEGISYSESFSGISNPNGIGKNGKQRWTEMAFRKRTKKGSGQAVETEEAAPTPREQQTAQSLGGMITTVAAAIAHINRGGSLSKISPDILQQSLTKMSQIKRDTIGKNRLMLTMPNATSMSNNHLRQSLRHWRNATLPKSSSILALRHPTLRFLVLATIESM